MPSGQTHDRITLWSLPVVAGITLAVTRSSQLTLIAAGGFLFSGLMFGPDLDIHSRQFQRWGWFRWIWQPYQKTLRHRSLWSHGPIVGTTLRVLYLMVCIALVSGLGYSLWQLFQSMTSAHGTPFKLPVIEGNAIAVKTHALLTQFLIMIQYGWLHFHVDAIALFLGLETGAMSHSLSDWIGSGLKAFRKLH